MNKLQKLKIISKELKTILKKLEKNALDLSKEKDSFFDEKIYFIKLAYATKDNLSDICRFVEKKIHPTR